MSQWLKTLWRNLTHKQIVDDDLAQELHSYQAMLLEEKTRAGMDRQAALRAAQLEMEGMEQIKEQVRDVRLGVTIETFLSELRQSLRSLRRNKALTLLCTAMLALGIGAGTLVFSIFYAALVQPLPFQEPSRLFELSESRRARGIDAAAFSEANFWDVRAQNHSFKEVAAFHYDEANLTGEGPAEKVTDRSVTAGFFRTLGVSPILGRDFSYSEDRNGSSNGVIILGNKFWRSRFHADPKIIGKVLRLNDKAATVIGVLPPGEPWIDDQIYQLFGYRSDAERGSWEYSVVARLAPGVTAQSAQMDLAQVAAALDKAYPDADKGIGFSLAPASSWISSDNTRRALWVLLGAVSFLLLIACLNMANLLLARGTSRQREIAIRIALGAGRARLIRFVLLESLILGILGALLGLAFAAGALRSLQAMQISGIPRLAEASLNPWVLAFAAALALLTGLLSGVIPALQTPASGTASTIRDSDHQTGSRAQGRLRSLLVAAEVAISFLLLVGAGLLVRSFSELMAVNRGFQTESRLVFSVSMPESYYQHGVGKQFLDRFFARLAALPQVISAGAVSSLPVEGANTGMGIDAVSSQNANPSGPPPWAGWRIITPGYLPSIGLPLLRGRNFDEQDKPVWTEKGQSAPHRRVLISQRLADLLFSKEDPIGKRVQLWKGQGGMDAEVAGVVANSHERGLASDTALTVYLPYGNIAPVSQFVLHTRGNPLAVAPAVRAIVASLDPNLPIADIRPFEEVVHRSLSPQRFNVILLGTFSALALLLATTGIYGVLSYTMNRRTAEIGLRVALGASPTNILGIALTQGMRPAFAGMLFGALGAWWLSRYLEALLFGIKPFDSATYILVAIILLATALFACLLPGRRALRIDPATALRTD